VRLLTRREARRLSHSSYPILGQSLIEERENLDRNTSSGTRRPKAINQTGRLGSCADLFTAPITPTNCARLCQASRKACGKTTWQGNQHNRADVKTHHFFTAPTKTRTNCTRLCQLAAQLAGEKTPQPCDRVREKRLLRRIPPKEERETLYLTNFSRSRRPSTINQAGNDTP
jgi:hypothetical protein